MFVFYDDVQYDKRGWRNRNRIKTPHGVKWLTIPVHSKGAQTKNIPINNIKICWDQPWNLDHWKAVQQSYSKAPYFDHYQETLGALYRLKYEYLADLIIEFSKTMAHLLGISNTRLLRSSELENITGTKSDRLINICKKLGATHYISGPSAKNYIDNEKFRQEGIALEYMDYDYPEYHQLYPPYEPHISIIDLLFMTGPDALKYIISDD